MSKIIFVCASLQSGGAERVLSVLSSKLAVHYNGVQYVMWYDAPVFYQIDERIKLVSIEKEVKSKNTIKKILWLRSYIKQQSPDLVLSFSAPFNMLALTSLLFTKYRTIACERVDPRSFRWGKILKILRNILYHTADGILVQTQMSKDYFKGKLYRKSDIIFNPITMSHENIGSSLRYSKSNIIVTAARLCKQKRQDLLIQTFARFLSIHPDYKLVIYGSGPEKQNLINLANKLNIGNNVEMPGSVKDLWDRMKPAKMFVLPSLFEGMSNSMIEAMCLGIPTISTKVSGATDLIIHEKNGILIDIDDADALLHYMCKIVEDEEFACRLGMEGSKIYNVLNSESISQKWIDYIDSKILNNI